MTIRVAFAGCGNVVSAFVQGSAALRKGAEPIGILSALDAFCPPNAVEIAVAFDVHRGRVGKDLSEAIFVPPNNTQFVCQPDGLGAPVLKGPVLDGLESAIVHHIPVNDGQAVADVTRELRERRIDVLVIVLPTGAQRAAEFYADAALDAGCAVVNGMPATIARLPGMAAKALERRLPIIGDDVKSQVGATLIHRALASLFPMRGAVLDRTIQLDWGGDMDFCNLTSNGRYELGKRQGKTESVISALPNRDTVEAQISAVDYIPFLRNQKEAYTRLEGRIFGGVSVRVDVMMQVIDGYNSAGILFDAIRVASIAMELGHSGVVNPACSLFCKNPPMQQDDAVAHEQLMSFIDPTR
jgi:myo-inositol-1-phosphate synthase